MSYVSIRMEADPRQFPRYYVNLRSRLSGPAEEELTVWTVDLAGGGARIGLDAPSASAIEGPGWVLAIPGIGTFPVEARWRRGTTIGTEFMIADRDKDDLARRLKLLVGNLH